MAKSDYLNTNDNAFVAQLQTFKTNIGSYATILGINQPQITAQAADADYYGYVVACQQLIQNGAYQWSDWKKLTRDGGSPPVTGAPLAPVFPPAVPPVAPGVETRFRVLVKQIKANSNYNSSIGNSLGIEGSQPVAPDLTTVQPELDATLSGGQVLVGWGWGGHTAYLDMIELMVDRGDGKGFGLLAYDTTPGYTDTTPLPVTPTKWKYKGIYRVGDQRVGLWSNEVSIIVGG